MDPPNGTVTFLFTDIQGSTQLWQRYPSEMPKALARHHLLLQQAIEDHSGYIFQIIGDAFCAAFHTARDGLLAALAAQRSLQAEPWGATGSIQVRMALHTGAAELRAGDKTSGEYLSGLTLSRTARLLSAGHGGQVLLSQPVHNLLAYEIPDDVDLLDLGEHRLKDLQLPEHIFQLVTPDLPSHFPPIKALDSYPNNLPIQLSSFIGRERETAEIVHLLSPSLANQTSRPAVRLVTLVGPGGTGKTRLSIQVGSELLEAFSEGVWLVELASLTDPGLVPQTVAAILGATEKPDQSMTATLIEHIRYESLLLILDNCEHLVKACAQLAAELLEACPGLTILASSREGLRIAGETIYPVPTLSLPSSLDAGMDLEILESYESFRLFVDRARAVQPRFQLNQENSRAIIQICRQVDGIPLAIEMAAARTRMLSPSQIAARLSDRFRLLTDGGRLAPVRQQTLHALIDWSYDLLPESERRLLRGLSVFSGGWTLEAAEEICAGSVSTSELNLSGQPEIAPLDIFELLDQLVNKSLVVLDYDPAGETRYNFLDTIRQYSWERLVETGMLEQFLNRQLRYYLQFAITAEQFLEGAEQVDWMDRLEKEIDNIRAALRWACHPDRYEKGLRMAEALKIFWYTRGYFSEGRDWLEKLLSLTERPTHQRALALDQAGFLARYQCDYHAASNFIQDSLVIWRTLGDRKGLADSLTNLGYVTLFQGDLVTAQQLYEESLQINRSTGNQQGIADALSHLGMIAFYQGDLEQAGVLHNESLTIWRRLGDKIGISHALNRLASVAFQAGQLEEAHRMALESLRAARDLKYSEGIAWSLEIFAAYATARGQPKQAVLLEVIYTKYRQMMSLPASPAQRERLENWLLQAHQAISREEMEQIQAVGQRIAADQVITNILDGHPLSIPA